MIEIRSANGQVVYRQATATSIKNALEIAAINRDCIQHALISNEDLSSGNFEGLALRGCEFENCNLEETDFWSTNITNCTFQHCIFQSTNFKEAELTSVVFNGTRDTEQNIPNALMAAEPALGDDLAQLITIHAAPNLFLAINLQKTLFNGCSFENLTFERCDFTNATIRNSNFAGCSLRQADLSTTLFQRNRLERSDLQHVKLIDRTISATHFKSCDLSGAHLSGADFHHCTFSHLRCCQLNASRSGTGPTYLIHCHVIHCDFTAANLSDSVLQRSKFKHITFDGTNLTSAILDFSELICCNFQNGARFTNTKIKGGAWRECILTDAAYQNASFRNVHMKDVTFTQTPPPATDPVQSLPSPS